MSGIFSGWPESFQLTPPAALPLSAPLLPNNEEEPKWVPPPNSPSSVLMLIDAEDNAFIIPRPGSHAETIVVAREIFYLPVDAKILLKTNVGEHLAVITPKTWPVLDWFSSFNEVCMVRVELYNEDSVLGRRKRAKEAAARARAARVARADTAGEKEEGEDEYDNVSDLSVTIESEMKVRGAKDSRLYSVSTTPPDPKRRTYLKFAPLSCEVDAY